VDDGRGIPCDKHAATGLSALETVLCVLHAGGKFGGAASGYRVSGGLHGVGLSVVNALSESLAVTVLRDGQRHTFECSRGVPLGPLQSVPDADASKTRSGTLVRFKPDAAIFEAAQNRTFDADLIATRLDELAYLYAGLRLDLIDERKGTSRSFVHAGGIQEYADQFCAGKTPLHAALSPQKPLLVKGEKSGVEVEVALRWNVESYGETVVSFANGIRTREGGTHVDGLKASITRNVNSKLKEWSASSSTTTKRTRPRQKKKSPSASSSSATAYENIPGEYIREGLVAVVAVHVPDTEFEGQTKNKLGGKDVKGAVDSVVSEALQRLFEVEPKALAAIQAKAQAAQAASAAAKAARELSRKKSSAAGLGTSVLPGKLTDCTSRVADEAEIFIVEGDSAAGSAKQGRDRVTQAILPLRGKILNVEKCTVDKIYSNAELQALMSALGVVADGGDGGAVDLSTLRYGRVIIMTDADVDGAHIRTLILTFFYRFFGDLVKNGHVYVACPPLYKVSARGRPDQYVWTDDELDQLTSSGSSFTIQRFKGLGEMMPEQLWTTTMDPASRKLQQVQVADAAQASAVVTLLMGDRVADRKSFIAAESASVADVDLDV